jgi:transglutaminase-like putative cysteine protease
VGDNLIYTYNGYNWGAQAALGEMGSDCTEFSSLLIALCRAAGIPARYLEGLNYRGLNSQVEARMEHAWTEIFLPGIGWVPVDPTLGREEITREHYFAQLPADHIIVTIGRHPSTLRGHSYFTHLYWGGDQAVIEIQNYGWEIELVE